MAKIAMIVALAHYCERYQKQIRSGWRALVVPCLLISLVAGLVFVEPDRGTSILLAAVGACILLIAGVKYIYFIPPIVAALIGLAISLMGDPMRSKRILSWWDLESTKDGVGYQAYQAMLAFGSGGMVGRGLGNGRQKLGFVPEHHRRRIGPCGDVARPGGIPGGDFVRRLYRLEFQGYLRVAPGKRRHLVDRNASIHQYRRGHKRPAEQRSAIALYRIRRNQFDDHAGFSGRFIEHRPSLGKRRRSSVRGEIP
jgi:hypothetical protein